jgi:oligopeptidase B
MLDESLPLTVHEYDEWGNPQTKEVFEYLKTYDPYFNIKKQAYPAILITASTLDIRVPYWQILKFAAKLRAHKTDSNVMMVKRTLRCRVRISMSTS